MPFSQVNFYTRYKNKQRHMIIFIKNPVYRSNLLQYKTIQAASILMQEQSADPNNAPINLDSSNESNEIDQILERKPYGDGYMYLIKWLNQKQNTWEPISNLKKARKIVKQFNAKCDIKQKLAVKTPRLKKMSNKRQTQQHTQRNIEVQVSSSSSSELSAEVVNHKQNSKKRAQKQKKISKMKHNETKNKNEKNKQKTQNVPKTIVIRGNMQKQLYHYKSKPIASEPQKFWEKQGRSLGRIHKHFFENGQLIFNVNINNQQELVCGTAYLTLAELSIQYEEKIIEYMQNWAKNYMLQEEVRNTQEYRQFERYWSQIQ